jgi:DNA repair protein RadA/Sms
VARIEQRIAEAEKLGFEKFFLSKFHKGIPRPRHITLVPVEKIETLTKEVFRPVK